MSKYDDDECLNSGSHGAVVEDWLKQRREIERLRLALDGISEKAREWAAHYEPASDGRNTFVMFAEWVEGLSFTPRIETT